MREPVCQKPRRSAPSRSGHPAPLERSAGPLLAALLAVVASAAGCHSREPPAMLEDADVVLVYVDTLRADRLGYSGHARARTPNLDGWAREGVRFTRAYTPSPWTFPATASLFTGLYPAAHGGGIDGSPRDLSRTPRPRRIGEGFTTLAESLRADGYRTALIASNPYLMQGNQQGFEHVDVVKQSADQRVDAALDWLSTTPSDEPCFLVLHLIDVHEPNRAPPELIEQDPVLRGLADNEVVYASRWRKVYAGKTPAPEREFGVYRARREALYDTSIQHVDRELGRLVSSAGARARPLLLVFTADHGEEFWDHVELERARFDDPRGHYGIGHGHTLFEELVRVPLFLHARGLAPATVEAPVSLVDLLPTIVELVGARHDAPLQGRSLVPGLTGSALEERPLFFSEPCFGGDQRAILSQDQKLIESEGAGRFLFDLATDPLERTDLASASSARLADLTSELEHHRRESEELRGRLGGASPQTSDELSPAELEALRELGYVGEEESAASAGEDR